MIVSSITIQMSDLPDCPFKRELEHIVIEKPTAVALNAVAVLGDDDHWRCRIGYPVNLKHVTSIARARASSANLPMDVSANGAVVPERIGRHLFPSMAAYPYGE